MSELQKRFAVAGIGIPSVLGLVYMGGWFIAVPLAGFAGLAAHEVFRLAAKKEVAPIGPLGCATAAALVLLAGFKPTFATYAPYALAVLGVSVAICIATALVARHPARSPLADVSVTLFGSVYVGLSLAFMPLLHALPTHLGWSSAGGTALGGLMVVALPLAATWIGDAAAFFAGTAWGKKKLAPSISPNKSWVGFWAAVFGASFAGVAWVFIAGRYLPGLDLPWWVALVLGALLGVAAVVGDLAESLFKREADVKDSGTFFPGHGGVLDRIDSLTLTIPTAFVALVLASVAL
jgi:phosphatidate cytidylyltransferase